MSDELLLDMIRTMPITALSDLTGISHSLVLEKLRTDLVDFVRRQLNAGQVFMSWPDAWEAYCEFVGQKERGSSGGN